MSDSLYGELSLDVIGGDNKIEQEVEIGVVGEYCAQCIIWFSFDAYILASVMGWGKVRINPGARAARCLGIVRSNVELRGKAASQDGWLHMPPEKYPCSGMCNLETRALTYRKSSSHSLNRWWGWGNFANFSGISQVQDSTFMLVKAFTMRKVVRKPVSWVASRHP